MPDAREFNFDGLVGPTYTFSGLAYGNLASMHSGGTPSNPRQAALEGLGKMRLLMELGIGQVILPPQERPHLPTLRRLGFTGSEGSMLEQALRTANRKHDVIAVLVTDPRELELPGVGLVALRDAESGRARLYDTGSPDFRSEVARRAAERVRSLERRLRGSGIDFIHIDASGSVVDPLVQFFRMRERRARR